MDNELLQAISDMMDSKLSIIIANMATKDDLKAIENKVSGIENKVSNMENKLNETFDELMLVEKIALENKESIKTLNEKYDTLLLKADNTDLLLRLINRQADEMDSLKARIEMLEKKIS